ncbi:MAG: DNRLRE domain-containing protein [Candidatus Microbacterium phytovorans]|uniref:DNRLRE domain-containing protein n=1 Tax=Candidatus Microbacterium phytovorans TaxID=3121374 RepID=A0AAJ5W1Q8_9MICO|nr:DNRLRE domain-containing protein [Microbacterium sp.]WEK13379.1 MAG: DNRLRE domain-containing protein [Microbacterium sp.]
MRTRIFASAVAVFALVVGVVVATPAAPAQAISAGVSFSADNLGTWQTNGVVRAVAASKGKVVAVGEFTQIRPGAGMSGSARNVTGVAIFEADTGAPSTCQLPATLSGGTARLYTAEASPDGSTVVVGGNFNSIGGVSRTRIAEINVETCTVTSFNVSGVSSFVYSLEVTADAVYFGGLFQTVAGQPRRSFAKVNRAGVLDETWIADAVGNMETRPEPGIECRTTADASSRGLAIAASPDGSKIALGGSFYTVNGTNTHSIALVDANTGAVTRAYPSNPLNWGDGSNFIHPCSITKAIVSDGSSFYIGNEGSGGGVFDGAARLNWSTGNQDWRDTCLGAVQALQIENGKLYQAHHHHDCSSTGQFPDGRRIYLSVTDTQDPMQKQLGWFPTLNDGTGEGIGGRGLTVATKNGQKYFWVGGEFTAVNGGAQQGLTRFSTTDTGNPPTPSINVRAVTPGALQIVARSVYDPDDSPLQYILYRNNVQLGDPVSVETTWWTRPQVTFVDSTATPGVSYSYRVRAVDAAGNQSALSAAQNGVASATASSYAATVVADQPDLYWRYDDAGAWVIDRSGKVGSAKNGIAQNGVTYAAGAIPGDSSSSAVFDGASQYVWNDQIASGPSTYTIETWFKTSSTTGGSMVSYGNGRPRTDNGNDTMSGSYDRIVYMENATGRIRFGIYNGQIRTLRSDLAYNDDQWHHVVATQGSNGMRLYIDGAEVGRNNVTNAQQYFGTWRVGGDNLNSWPENGGNNNTASRFFDGQLDETAVYGSVLSQNKAIDHFLAGGGEMDLNEAPADAYGAAVFGDNPTSYWRFDEASGSVAEDSSFLGARDGVIGSAVTRFTEGTKIPGGAITTPGTNSNGSGIVRTGLVAAPSEYSLEFWVNTTTTSGGKIIGFENSPTDSGNNYDKQVYMLNDGRLRFGIYNGAVQSVTTTSSLNNGQWHHVVATQGSAGMRIYVDGVQQGANAVTNAETGDGYWRVGGGNLGGWPDSSSSHYFSGKLDEVAIYPTALTGAAVTNHYAIGLQDSTPPTVPTNVAHTGTTSVDLTWSASADANGVAGYRIYRGTSAGFEITPSALVGDVTTTSWSDPNTTPGTRYYKVTAYDVAGNESTSGSAHEVVLADVTAPSAVSGLATSVAGTDVALTWNAATDDVAVDHYDVYRSVTSGFAIADGTRIAQPATAAYTDVNVGEGTWYYRVVAVDAAGNAGTASAQATAVVDIDTDAPSVPTGVEATASADGTVDVAWSASTDDVGVVGYRVYRGTTAGFTADADSLVADGVTATTWTDPATTIGTRYYKVAAYDLAGNISAASAAASATVADTENPTTPTGLTATASGSDAELSWTASTDNISVERYAVYRGTTAGFSIAGLTPIAQPTGTSYTDEGLADGQYFYRVVAIDGAGNRSAATGSQGVTIDTSEPVEPVTVTADVQADTMVAQGAANTVYGASNQISARGGSTGQIESYLRFAIPAAPAGTTLTGATLRVTTSTDSTANSTGTHQVSILTGSWSEATTTWNNRPTTGFGSSIGQLTGATALNTTYTVTLDASALASLAGSDVSFALRTTSTDNVRLVSKEGTGTTRRPALILEFTPGTTPEPEPDTAAPSVPAGLQGTGTAAGNVSLNWTASTDNVGVTGYRVYRGTTAGFTANSSSQVGTPSGTSFSQSDVAAGTWYYRVAAVDAAGNVSAASAAVAVEVPEAPEEPLEPVVTEVVALKDALVAQSSTSTNYGAATYLSTRGGTSGALQSYLAFELPAAPEGRVLTSAVLRLRTTSDSTSGSADTHDVKLVGSAWTESTLTWANRPTDAGATVGSLSGLTALSTTYERELTASTLAPLSGTTVGFLVTDNGTDNLRFWSKDAGTAANRPTLVLTYTAAP